MKKIIFPKDSIILNENEINTIEGGNSANGYPNGFPDVIRDIFAMTMNRLLTIIGNAVFDPVDVINRSIRNVTNPYASESVPIETNIANSNSDSRTALM